MAKSPNDSPIPEDYVPLSGSERHPSKAARLVGPTDANETFKLTIVLRRRTDGPRMPGNDYYAKTRPCERPRVSQEEFAKKYGAHPEDVARVVRFAEESGLTVLRTHLARRTVEVSATVALFSKAFAVALGRYEHTLPLSNGKKDVPSVENYRGRDGFIHVPGDLAELLVGVFGLDNRTITGSCGNGDPAFTNPVSMALLRTIYNFPTNSAKGQTIGIMSPTAGHGGFFESDFNSRLTPTNPVVTAISTDGSINGSVQVVTFGVTLINGTELNFQYLPPQVTVGSNVWCNNIIFGAKVVSISGTTVKINQEVSAQIDNDTTISFNVDPETSHDIWIAALAAPEANIAVYFSAGYQAGWVAMINRAVHPETADPECSVLSASYFIANGDDAAGLAVQGTSLGCLAAVSAAFADAAVYGRTFCVSSGDWGADAAVGNGKAHAMYPASDPNVLSVGGTTVGYADSAQTMLQEFVWNDAALGPSPQWGTTGGGVSCNFPRPDYQSEVSVPPSLNNGFLGRGVPDVAANASSNSSIEGLFYSGFFSNAAGTSASAPLWAGLIAVINAALNEWVGFINPAIYTIGSSAFRAIDPPPGPTNNGNSGVTGYNAAPGWDACTGWGSPNGIALLLALQPLPSVFITGGYQSPDIILTDPVTGDQVALGGLPGGSWDTLLVPEKAYALSAIIHNDSVTAASGVQVSFWAIPGGVGTSGTLLDTIQLVSVPAFSPATVLSTNPFFGPAPGEHMCAAVSIYNPGTGCSTNAMNALDIPDPGTLGAQMCSAWRNTDSMFGTMGSGFRFKLGLGDFPFHLAEPIKLRINPIHVPSKWLQSPKVREIASRHGTAGTEPRMPPYLMPALQRTLPAIDLKSKVTTRGHGKMAPKGTGLWEFLPAAGDTGHSFEVAGEIPVTAKKGDIVLVKVAAGYPRVEKRAARTVEFLQVIHIRAE